MLNGKHGVVFGVANKCSIAFACARAAAEAGARVILTYQGERLKEGVESVRATSSIATITTSQRTLVFKGPSGRWSDQNRPLR